MEFPIKNSIYIEVDTDREIPIKFHKPNGTVAPTNPQEAANMLLTDIACLAEAITTLIYIAGKHEYADKNELINATIKTLYGALETSDNNPSETETNNGH
jgi:hypothetical protein